MLYLCSARGHCINSRIGPTWDNPKSPYHVQQPIKMASFRIVPRRTSVPARLGKGQGAKEIGHNLARERPKFGHNLVRKRHKIFYA